MTFSQVEMFKLSFLMFVGNILFLGMIYSCYGDEIVQEIEKLVYFTICCHGDRFAPLLLILQHFTAKFAKYFNVLDSNFPMMCLIYM